jgi:DNA-binding beta-propeller fold protein YncE
MVTISPDGRFLYAAMRAAEAGYGRRPTAAIAVFARDPGGALRQPRGNAGCLSAAVRPGCRALPLLAGTSATAMSPDGRHVYVATSGRASVVILRRAARTGVLRRVRGHGGCLRLRGRRSACQTARGVGGIHTLIVSADGRNLYTSNTREVTGFGRDPATGRLTQLPGVAGCMGFGSDRRGCPRHGPTSNGFPELARSADPAELIYANADENDEPLIFRRAPGSGRLSPIAPACASECESNSAAGALWLSPDGRTAYVADGEGVISLWQRDPQSRRLTTRQVVYRACRGSCYRGPASLRVTADGRNLYASYNGFGILAFSRDPATGALLRLSGPTGCVAVSSRRRGCVSAAGLLAPDDLLIAPDERTLYAVTESAELFSVVALRRTPALEAAHICRCRM